MAAFLWAILALASPVRLGAQPPEPAFDPGKAPFAAKAGGQALPYRVQALFVLPGEGVPIKLPEEGGAAFAVEAASGTLARQGPGRWLWQAPESPGLWPLRLVREKPAAELLLNAFVLVPYAELREGRLKGYRVGRYPKPPPGDPIYGPPRGFVELLPELEEVRVSPHFTLGQFACKQASPYPKYLVLEARLLEALELVLEELNARGIRAGGLAVLSGYRTPAHNRRIRQALHSRHLWGDAADVYVDEAPRDGWMDDIDRDGKADRKDARELYRIIEDVLDRPGNERFAGGLAAYGSRPGRGPFVHVDLRGSRVRWGRR